MLPLAGQLERTARRLTRASADATDLVQETYLRAYRGFDRFLEGTSCKAWLFTILYSVFVNRYRKSRREAHALSLDEVEAEFAHLLEDASNAVAAVHPRRASHEVEAAIGRLPEAFRSAVELVDLNDLSYEDAAAVLNCPVGTLRSRLFRARKRLFASLHDYAIESGYLRPSKQE